MQIQNQSLEEVSPEITPNKYCTFWVDPNGSRLYETQSLFIAFEGLKSYLQTVLIANRTYRVDAYPSFGEEDLGLGYAIILAKITNGLGMTYSLWGEKI